MSAHETGQRVVLASTGMVRVPPRVGGAVEAYVSDLCRILLSNGVGVTLVAPIRNPAPFEGGELVDVPTSFDSFPLKPMSSALAHILGGARIAQSVRSCLARESLNGQSVLHVNEEISAALLMRTLPRIPKVFTLHNPPPINGSNTTGWLDSTLRTLGGEWTRRFVASKADAVVVLTSYFRQFLVESWHIPSDHIHVLPLPIDTNLYAPSTAPHDGYRVLFVGRFDLRKNVKSLLRAMQHLDQDVHLTLVGDGPLRASIEAYVRANDLDHKVEILSRLRNEELIGVYQRSDVFVLPSVLESYGRVVVEAAACGLPVILPDAPYFRDFRDQGFAEFLPDCSPQALANAICDLRRDPDRQRRMGDAARRFAVDNNGFERFAARLQAVYNAVRR